MPLSGRSGAVSCRRSHLLLLVLVQVLHLAVGKKADINVIDLNTLRLHHPELRHDLPAGGKRLVQRVGGYEATIVAGTPIFERGQETGARPGKLVRSTI